MFAYWQGKIKGGTKSEIPITNLDFFPTILEVAGISRPQEKVLDGTSILPVLTENAEIEERPLCK